MKAVLKYFDGLHVLFVTVTGDSWADCVDEHTKSMTKLQLLT